MVGPQAKRAAVAVLMTERGFGVWSWSCPGFADSLALGSQAVSGMVVGCSVAGNFPSA